MPPWMGALPESSVVDCGCNVQRADSVDSTTLLYVGCYTHDSPVGIHVYDATDPHGELAKRSEVEGVEHASFLAAHPNGRFLYCVSEVPSAEGGEVVAFGIDRRSGSLTMIDRVASQGAAPCYVSIDADGEHLYVANYLSGTVAVYALAPDGRFDRLVARHQHHGSGPTSRQDGPHAHCILAGPAGDSVHAVDLGTDRVVQYRHGGPNHAAAFEPVGELVVRPGTGPRHITFHPTEPVAFLVGELDSTIATLEVDPDTGKLSLIDTCSTLPEDFAGESIGAEVRVHPDGRHVYVSNRGHNSIAVFGHGAGTGLEPLGNVASGGESPRNFAIHPAGRAMLVANQHSDTIVAFEIDPRTGVPRQGDAVHVVSQPVCLHYLEVVV